MSMHAIHVDISNFIQLDSHISPHKFFYLGYFHYIAV